MEKRLDDSDVYIVSLQEKIKALVTEKETLVQAKKDLEKEKEQFQVMMCMCTEPPSKSVGDIFSFLLVAVPSISCIKVNVKVGYLLQRLLHEPDS